jgi:hypothetical protein
MPKEVKLRAASDTNQASSSTWFGAASSTVMRRIVMHKVLLALTTAAALGCADRNIDIARQLMQKDPAGGPPTVVTVANCQSYGEMGMDRLCVVDSDGRSYSVAGAATTGTMIVTTEAPPYGVYFLFKHDWTPLATDVSTDGADASVRVYAAACSIQDGCAPEFDEANRIAARASVTEEGGVLVTVHTAQPSGTQVVVKLVYSALFRGRVTPADGSACNLPDDLCATGMVDRMGWVERFYVGTAPAATTADGSTSMGTGTSKN